MFKFKNSYLHLGTSFYSLSKPGTFSQPEIIFFNDTLFEQLTDQSPIQYESEFLAKVFSGQEKIPDGIYYSQVYAAHQFGHFVPRLGDGRAIFIGEVESNNQLFDIQLKGAGPTEYSRRGDGFSALGPVLREYIVSEFMHALNIPSTRALSAIKTNHKVYRETILDGGVLTRVAASHIRIGTFQYFLAERSIENLEKLLRYSIERHYPHILTDGNPEDYAIYFLRAVINRQTSLVAKWMSVGFIHGVMNTDNMSISGETIDFGPCAFMDYFNFNQVYSYIDRDGRYAYSNQPKILAWNLGRLADTLIPILVKNKNVSEEMAIELLNRELSEINSLFEEKFTHEFALKLGIESFDIEIKKSFLENIFQIMSDHQLDFTNTYRSLAEKLFDESLIIDSSLQEYFEELVNTLKSKNINLFELGNRLKKINPIYIPRNHLIELAINDAYNNQFDSIKNLHQVLKDPFTKREIDEQFSQPPTKEQIVKNTFCGT
jgi:uncharacterized protein YdiU (UPF0061 family)